MCHISIMHYRAFIATYSVTRLCCCGCGVHVQVRILRNTAVDGGAVSVDSASTLTIKGANNIFRGNTATSNGGALRVSGAVATIEGNLCATGNRALGRVGGFASLLFQDNQLIFEATSQVKFGANVDCGGPNTLFLEADAQAPGPRQPKVRCGGAASAPWAYSVGATYTIIGTACTTACNSAFVAGTQNTCDECGAPGWDEARCACVVSVPAWPRTYHPRTYDRTSVAKEKVQHGVIVTERDPAALRACMFASGNEHVCCCHGGKPRQPCYQNFI